MFIQIYALDLLFIYFLILLEMSMAAYIANTYTTHMAGKKNHSTKINTFYDDKHTEPCKKNYYFLFTVY